MNIKKERCKTAGWKWPLRQRFFRRIQKLNLGGSRILYGYDTLNTLADKEYEADNLGSVIYSDRKRVSL